MYKPTTALKKIANLTKKTRIIQGSQGAGKTISILILLINACLHNKRFRVTIIQGELSKAKKTIMEDFLDIMTSYEIFERPSWNKTESKYTFRTGSYIEFIGLDQGDVGKGFRRDVVYFNELNKGGISLEAYNQFASRSKLTFADYNPDMRFFAHDEIIEDPDTDFLVLTFHDNEYLPESELKEILKYKERGFYDPNLEEIFERSNIKNSYWANRWRVYGLGLVGSLEGQIYTNYKIIHRIPKDARYVGSGLDFGFAGSPAALVDHYVFNGKNLYDEKLYRTGLHNSDLARIIKGEKRLVYADSAEPKSISEIKGYGCQIYPTIKTRDAINAGIDLLQEDTIYVTKTSKNMIFELQNYVWDKDRAGETIPKPVKAHDHLMDAMRYEKLATHNRRSGRYSYA